MQWWHSVGRLSRLFSPSSLVAGVDVGSYAVRLVLAERVSERPAVVLRGRGVAPSRGLRYGYIVNKQAATRAVEQALQQAQKDDDRPVAHAFVGVGGTSLDEFHARGETLVSNPDQVITAADIAHAQENAQEQLKEALRNYTILHAFPLRYFIDGKEMPVTSLEGMRGNRIAIDYLFVATIEKHLTDLLEAVEDAGLTVKSVYASPIAAGYTMLTREQRQIGAALANIGAHTLSLVVFEKDVPISVKVFPIGSSAITNDIALALQVDHRQAERLKLKQLAAEDEVRTVVQEISARRMEEMFRLIDRHLQALQRSRLLPGGIVITGGGSAASQVQDVARSILALPTRVGGANDASSNQRALHVRDASWAVAYGVVLLGLQEAAGLAPRGVNPTPPIWRSLWEWARGYLP